jgi:hypothetical protein
VERITPRYVFEARIRISLQRGSEDLGMEGWARDISETGLSAFTARGLTVGELVTLEIPLALSSRVRIPAKVVRCLGTQYGFQFTALSPNQRAEIRSAVKGRAELGTDEQLPGATLLKSETGPSRLEAETGRATNTDFAERARTLIKIGYTPKVAVELVLHEVEVEHGGTSSIMDKARADAEAFLSKVRRGLI